MHPYPSLDTSNPWLPNLTRGITGFAIAQGEGNGYDGRFNLGKKSETDIDDSNHYTLPASLSKQLIQLHSREMEMRDDLICESNQKRI
jgi:hypothetical protein